MIRRGRAAFESQFPLRIVNLHDVNGGADREENVDEDADKKKAARAQTRPKRGARRGAFRRGDWVAFFHGRSGHRLQKLLA